MANEAIKIKQTLSYQVYPPTPHIDPVPFFSQPDATQQKLFSHRMLSFPLRNLVMTKIKDPLRKALIGGSSFYRLAMTFGIILLVAWRIRKYVGKVTKENSVFKNVHVLLDLAGLIKECHHNPGREGMVNSAMEILVAIIEHDPYYRHIGYCAVDYIIKQAQVGKWIQAELPPAVLKSCWDNDRFQGG